MTDFWADMLLETRESIPAVRAEEERRAIDLLEQDYGIALAPIDPKELAGPGFQLLPADTFAHISGALQPLPGLISGKMLQSAYQDAYQGACRLLIPAGSENLTFMKNGRLIQEFGEGAIDPTLVDAGGTIRRKAGVKKIDPPDIRAQQIAYLAFSAASIVTNQYFLQRIDKKLEAIQQTATEILHFLELDKQTQLQGCLKYLSDTYAALNSILENSDLRQAALNQVQEIKRQTLGNIDFYQREAQSGFDSFSKSSSKLFKNKKEINGHMSTIQTRISSYWLAIYVYQLAEALEIQLTQNLDHDYLLRIQKDVQGLAGEYKTLYQRYLELYVDGSDHSDYAEKYLAGLSSNELANLSAEIDLAKNDAEAHMQLLEKYQPLKNVRPLQLEAIPQSIQTLDEMHSGPVELAISGEKVYLKLPEH